ncbi:MAG: hypothetical protein P8L85_09670 [Rubripirellula sp.]|nr:hypothetical protein [Rubripirellula sp.]
MASKQILVASLASLLIGIGSGCSTLNLPNLPTLPFSSTGTDADMYKSPEFPSVGSVSEQAYHGVRQAKSQHAVVLEVVGDSEPVRVLPLPPGKTVYVSNLLEDTGVAKKLGAIEATLYRSEADSIGGLPMEVRVASDGRTVRPESDYALRPGDRLRVAEGTNPILEGLFGSILGL